MEFNYYTFPGIADNVLINKVLTVIKNFTGYSLNDLKCRNQKRSISDARHLFCALAHSKKIDKYVIANYIKRDRTTVLHSIKTVNQIKELKEKLTEINKLLCA